MSGIHPAGTHFTCFCWYKSTNTDTCGAAQLTAERAREQLAKEQLEKSKEQAEERVRTLELKIHETSEELQYKCRQLKETWEDASRHRAAEDAAHRRVRETEDEMRIMLKEMDRMKEAHAEKLAQLSEVFKQVYQPGK